MARTFIGELVLRLKDEMSGKAKTAASNLDSSMNRIQQAAKKLNQTSWGGQFEERLRKLGAGAQDVEKLRKAWDDLNRSISSRNLGKALAGVERSNFKVAAISEFAAIKSAWDAHAAHIERRTRTMAQNMRAALQPVLVALGGYTGAYLAGRMGTEGLKAASEEQRQKAEMKFAGLPEDDRARIDKRAEELAIKYRMPVSLFQEMLKDAALNLPSTDSALAISDHMAKGILILSNLFGDQSSSIDRLRAFNKAMDNIEKVSPEEYKFGLENYMKAQQVAGKDLDPASFAQAIKYARTSGKVFSSDFLFKWLPFIISETGGSDAGTQLRAGFDQFIVGRASKQALNRQKELGIRNDDGLIGKHAFTENPIKWMNDYLLPQLKSKGVNTEDETELAQVIGELTNNRLSGDLVSRALLSYEQYKRLAEQRLPNAMGLDAADQVQALNPFAGYQGLIDSLKNLAGAVGNDVMPTITAGLNSLASGINALQQAWRDGDPMAKLGITGAAVGAGIGAWKITAAIWGLMTAGTSLNTAAIALQAAAASLGGSGAVDGLTDGANKKKSPGGFWKGLGVATVIGSIAALLNDSKSIPQDEFQKALADMRKRQGLLGTASEAGDRRRQMEGLTTPYDPNTPGVSDYFKTQPRSVNPYDAATAAMRRRQAFEADTGPRGNTPGLGDIFKPQVDMGDVNAATSEATSAGQQIQSALSVSATPMVNTAQLREAVALANQLKAALAGIGGAVQQAHASVSRQMNRNFTDQGVTP
jgi:hypothetical protein